MNDMTKLTRTIFLFVGIAGLATAGHVRLVAAQLPRPVVVELFTSEGCSSCPPADALLTELAQEHGDVLPLAMHITYWDQLGWKDPYASASGTERQRRYAQLLGSDSIYTPQMVIDGTRDVVGSDRTGVFSALRDAGRQRGAAVPLHAVVDAGIVAIEVGDGQGAADVVLIGYDREHRTSVHRGENAGRTLTESNIVRSIATVGTWSGNTVTVRHPVPAGERLAVILQARDGRILGAATGG